MLADNLKLYGFAVELDGSDFLTTNQYSALREWLVEGPRTKSTPIVEM